MDRTKRCTVKWSAITDTNFTSYLSRDNNGFAIITGSKYIVLDFDSKHNPPQDIYNVLYDACNAVEKTPGGYHFWFTNDPSLTQFTSTTDIHWDNKKIKGLDIRAKGGICYCHPSIYGSDNGEICKYTWIKGDLSTATQITDDIIMRLAAPSTKQTDIYSILSDLSQERVDNYGYWVTVGIALKNSGYSCDIWDNWSRKSYKYKEGDCELKWNTFGAKEQQVTIASIYKWLKEDNYTSFLNLQMKQPDTLNLLLLATNASIADLFYNMNPYSYIYSTADGWYVLQPNNTWMCTGSTDIMSIPDILNAIRAECNKILAAMITRLNKNKEEDDIKQKALSAAFKKISSSGFLKGVTAFLPGLYYRQGIEREFNEKRHLFAFTNGVLDMNTFQFRDTQPDDYITVTCGYDYRAPEGVEKAKVREFLGKIWPNQAVLEYNLRAIGKALTGNNVEQIMHIFTGKGANGKSCLMDLCKMVFGDYYQTFSVTYLTKEHDGKDKPLPELAAARYARILVTSEPDDRDRFQINLLKNITGNEEVSFRGMYAKLPVKYVPQFKLWILTNDMPRLSKYDQAIERRMRCVHFPTRFVYAPRAENEQKRDDTLTQQFRCNEAWKYGLLGLLIDAMQELGATALEMPAEVKEFTEAYMLENNPVGAWLRQYYDITGSREDCIQKTELYNAFITDTGINKHQKIFGDEIVKCNINEKTIRGIRYYFGLVRKINDQGAEGAG
jgi:P4 family phage/plasmid primase-like protien